MSYGFKLIFFLPRLFGAFPFTFREGKARLNIPLVAYGLLLRVIFCVDSYGSMIRLRKNIYFYERNRFYFVNLAMTFIFLSVFASVCYAFLLLNSRLLRWVLTTCAKVDKDLREFEADGLGGYRRLFDGFVLLVGLLPGSLRAISVGQVTLENFLNSIHMFYLTTNLFMGVYPFIRTVDFLRGRFNQLRNILSQLDGPDKCSEMITTVRLHSILCSASKALNKCYSIQLLFFWFLTFEIIVTSCYFVVDAIIGNESCLMIFIKSLVIVFCCLICYLVIYVCEQASNEAKEFNTSLYQLMMDDNTSSISTNKKLRLHISMKREVVFTACGFFNLDYKLIHSIITASTTYLVVLIQFGQSKTELAAQSDGDISYSPALTVTVS